MEVIVEVTNLVRYIHNADFSDLEELHETGSGEQVAESEGFPLCELPYNARHYSEFENTSHYVFRPNDIDNFCNMAKTLVKPGIHSHLLFCFSFHSRSKIWSP